MKKHIIIHDDFIEVLMDGYNIIEHTIYDEEILQEAKELMAMLEQDEIATI